MIKQNILIKNIPSILWGEKSDRIYIYVHGKMSKKEDAKVFAEIANLKGYQVISFDLPEHGERKKDDYKCNPWNGVDDLKIISDYVQGKWNDIYLFSCSLGAYFSLLAYKDIEINKCLFLSPIVDMNYMIQNMFSWFNVTEKQLYEKGEIFTPVETLSWDYYNYVKNNLIKKWNPETHILYGSKDNLQSQNIIEDFAKRYNCHLTIANNCEHSFMQENENIIVEKWFREHI